MPSDNFQQFVLLFFLGLGLLLAAVMNVALRIAPTSHRAAGTMLAGGAALFACHLFEGDADLTRTVAIVWVAITIPVFILGTDTGTRWLVAVAERSKRPQAAWWCCGLLGVLTIALAAARYEGREESHVDAQTAELESLANLNRRTTPTLSRSETFFLRTDGGANVNVWEPVRKRSASEQAQVEERFFREVWNRDHVIRTAPPDDSVNCYGWVFTGGRFWIAEADVEKILDHNDYQDVNDPMPDDLVLYRKGGIVVHLAVVRYTAPGRSPIVEGKWGFNSVHLHAADMSPYGRELRFYRSPRAGHLLAGLPNRESPPLEDDRTE